MRFSFTTLALVLMAVLTTNKPTDRFGAHYAAGYGAAAVTATAQG